MIRRSLPARFGASLLALALSTTAHAEGTATQSVESVSAPGLEPAREAQRRFALGVTLYEEGDLQGALAEFRRAHQIFPNHKVLYNLGTVCRELYDWAAALSYYRAYLAEGGTTVPPDRRLQIERQVSELAQRVGRLDVEVKDGPADIVIDEQPTRPGSELLVNPGKRRLKVSYAGRPPVVKVIEVVSGDENHVVIERPTTVLKGVKLASASPDSAQVDLSESATTRRLRPQQRSRAAVWWTWSATALAGGAALGLGLTARQSSQMLATERTRYPASPANLADLSDRTRKLALATDVLAGTTAVLAAVAIYVSFSGPARVEPERVALAWRF